MKNKNVWVLLILLLTGVVLGGFIGNVTEGIPALSWLSLAESFGLNTPLVLDFGILVVTFGLSIRITMAGIIGVVLALLVYRWL